MADAYTEFLNLTKPEVGASRDAWGDKWNSNATKLDAWAKATDAAVKAAADAGTAALAKAVAKTGDTMTGELIGPVLTIKGAGGAVNLTGRDEATASVLYRAGKSFRVYDSSVQADVFSVAADGSAYFKQIGDLNNRIETRGQAWADNAANRCVQSIRWAYVGDQDITVGLGGMREDYGGSAITGRTTIISGDGNDVIVRNFRYRQLQFYIPNQGWVASYFA